MTTYKPGDRVLIEREIDHIHRDGVIVAGRDAYDPDDPRLRAAPPTSMWWHMLRCTIEDGWPVWSIDCPYNPDDRQKPCAMWEDWEADTPTELIPGCGLIHWMADTCADVDEGDET